MENIGTQTDKHTTGVRELDEMLERATYESIAMTWACLELSRKNNKLGDKITDFLKSEVKDFEEKKGGLDSESEVLPAEKWLSFLAGFQAGQDEPQAKAG